METMLPPPPPIQPNGLTPVITVGNRRLPQVSGTFTMQETQASHSSGRVHLRLTLAAQKYPIEGLGPVMFV